MNQAILIDQFKRLQNTLRSIATEERDPHDSTRGEVSPDGIKLYNKMAQRYNELFPDEPLFLFREDTLPINADHPKCSEILFQVENALAILHGSSENTKIEVDPIFRHRDFGSPTDLCFVLMPLRKELAPIYEDHIKKVILGIGLECKRADDFFNTSEIMEDIWENIFKARLIIADLTSKNPNVFYEVGIAHTLGKKVILITQNLADVPFDLRYLRHIQYEYTPRGMQIFEQQLEKTVTTVLHLKSK
ncbi:MAG: hypothetical protein WBW48_02730 [Anaerolineae bacterium]